MKGGEQIGDSVPLYKLKSLGGSCHMVGTKANRWGKEKNYHHFPQVEDSTTWSQKAFNRGKAGEWRGKWKEKR